MRTQRVREEKTDTIAAGIAAFLGTLGLCIVVILIVGSMTDMSAAFDRGFPWAVGFAALVGAMYLGRHRR